MKNNYPLLLSATIAVIILLLLSSCGTRKVFNKQTIFKSDSLIIENKHVLRQEIILNDIYPTTQDNINIANGVFQTGMHFDNTHLNGFGYNIIANRVAKIIKLYGW